MPVLSILEIKKCIKVAYLLRSPGILRSGNLSLGSWRDGVYDNIIIPSALKRGSAIAGGDGALERRTG